MKRVGHKKVLGLSIGERSLLVAEVVAGDKPEVRQLGELVYPEGLSPNNPQELGSALGAYLKTRQMTATHAVVGIPVRWLVAQAKDVPAVDEETLTSILRLQAEAEFSSELKDLVYDYTSQPQAGGANSSVLLLATPRRYVDAANTLCTAAGLTPVAITSSAMVLGDLTGKAVSRSALVLSVGAAGAEMTAPRGANAGVIRHLRSAVTPGEAPAPFVNELRRVVSTMPASNGSRELILWDGVGLDSKSLGTQIGFTIRNGELPSLGVQSTGAARNGEGRQYASAVALGLAGIEPSNLPIDFLHSRLAPPKAELIPRWAIYTGLGVILAILLGVLAYTDLQAKQKELNDLTVDAAAHKGDIDRAKEFVKDMSAAESFHGGDPRYLACMRDLTTAMTDERDTYARNVVLHDVPPTKGSAPGTKPTDPRTLTGTLSGSTSDQGKVQALLDNMRKVHGFKDVKLGSSNNAPGHQVTFTINFTYLLGPSARMPEPTLAPKKVAPTGAAPTGSSPTGAAPTRPAPTGVAPAGTPTTGASPKAATPAPTTQR